MRGLSIGWEGRALMERLDFDVPRGSIFAILGGSGSGKSTLLRNVIGLETPLAGSVEFPAASPSADRTPAIGVMFQSGALLGSLTLLENVLLPLETWLDLDREVLAVLARGRLAAVGLAGFEHHLPAEISGGMKKRGGIARALALDPRLLFLDEPSAGLDPVSAAELDELLLTLRDATGATICLVTHELASLFNIADECIMLDKAAKGIIARGDPRELRDADGDPRVARFFNRRTSKAP